MRLSRYASSQIHYSACRRRADGSRPHRPDHPQHAPGYSPTFLGTGPLPGPAPGCPSRRPRPQARTGSPQFELKWLTYSVVFAKGASWRSSLPSTPTADSSGMGKRGRHVVPRSAESTSSWKRSSRRSKNKGSASASPATPMPRRSCSTTSGVLPASDVAIHPRGRMSPARRSDDDRLRQRSETVHQIGSRASSLKSTCIAPAGDGLPTLDRQSADRHRVTSERPFHTHRNQTSSRPRSAGKDFWTLSGTRTFAENATSPSDSRGPGTTDGRHASIQAEDLLSPETSATDLLHGGQFGQPHR